MDLERCIIQQTLLVYFGHSKQINERQERGDTAHEAADSRLPATHANTQIHSSSHIQDQAVSSTIIVCVSRTQTFWRTYGTYTCHMWISQDVRIYGLYILSFCLIFRPNKKSFKFFVEPMMSIERQLVAQGTGNLPVHSIFQFGNTFYAFVCHTWASLLRTVLANELSKRYHVQSTTRLVSVSRMLRRSYAYNDNCR